MSYNPKSQCHPAVKLLFETMHQRRLRGRDVAAEAGYHRRTFDNWSSGQRSPNIAALEACLNVIGYTLIAVPKDARDTDR